MDRRRFLLTSLAGASRLRSPLRRSRPSRTEEPPAELETPPLGEALEP